ncbi:MAG: transporter [Nocardioides sp.]|jgi:EmrB/QacA subfamily drug resistance transporter|uniref:MFS transporter n=1 Tax=Nocardioides sp. TaxID=35761 RepID=UPI002631F3C4|nr:MFS transporter [Nocardioides sp.]MCW2834632.1 transporter [Nocardioides sp.]
MSAHSAPRRNTSLHETTEPEPRQPWTVLSLALIAQVLVVLDISVVNTALPTIGQSLHLQSSDLQWMVTAYLLMSGGGLLLGGRISDLLSRRRVFMTGMLIFTGASLLSGFASNANELIAGRGAQGVGAALMTPAALSLIMTTYQGAQRAKGLALWGAIGGLGIAAGVIAGGALTTWAGWQAIFWVNVPIGVAALIVAAHVLPREATTPSTFAQFDVLGAVSAVSGLGALMFAISGTESHGWTSPRTLLGLAVAAALLTAFVLVERRSAQPLVRPHTWSIRPLVSGTVVMLGVTGVLVGAVFLGSIFFQTVLGFSALRAGLGFLPLAAALVVGTHLAAHVSAHASARVVAATGLGIASAGSLLLSQAPSDATFLLNLLPGLLIVGLGAGIVFVAVSTSAMGGIPDEHAGMASGFMMTGHEVGAALGIAVLSAIATSAGPLTTATGAADAFSRGFVGAAVLSVAFAVFAALRMPATRGGGGSLHMH